jgi:hypothetical protein
MPKSKFWTIFSKINKNGKDYARCSLCHVELAYNSTDASTGCMVKHTKRYHPVKYSELYDKNNNDDQQKKDDNNRKQITIQAALVRRESLRIDSPKYGIEITNAILKMICVDLQPLSFIEDVGFRSVLKATEGRYVIPSRVTFRNKLIPELYTKVVDKLRTEISTHMFADKENLGLVCITTDAWTAKTTSSYITYNIHFIREDFKMVAYNIGTYEFKNDHTAENLRKHLCLALTHCGVLKSDKPDTQAPDLLFTDSDEEMDCTNNGESCEEDDSDIASDADSADADFPDDDEIQTLPGNIYITTDNAANVTKAVTESNFDHIRCFAHTLNLAVQKGLSITRIQRHLAKVRKIVKYFRKSNKAKYALQVRKLQISLLHHSVVILSYYYAKPA